MTDVHAWEEFVALETNEFNIINQICLLYDEVIEEYLFDDIFLTMNKKKFVQWVLSRT